MRMQHLPKTFFPIVLLLCCSMCARKGVDLRFSYQPGQTAQYHLVSEVKTKTTTNAQSSSYSLNIEMVVTSRVERLTEKGDAELLFTYDKIRYLNSQSPDKSDEVMNQLKNTRIVITMSPAGEITDVKGYESLPRLNIEDFNIFTILLKALPVFPRVPIEIGKKWEREQEYPIENGLVKGNMLVYKRFSLLDTVSQDNRRLAKIASEISMKFDVPQNENFSMKQDGNERMGLDGTGTIQFDLGLGEIRKANAAIFGKMVIAIKHPVTKDVFNTRVEMAQSININRL